MDIDKAREILGKDAVGASDEDIQRDIETAELLKNLFFDLYIKMKREGRLEEFYKKRPQAKKI